MENDELMIEHKIVIPPNVASENNGTGLSAGARQALQMYAKQFAGLPLRSKCKRHTTRTNKIQNTLELDPRTGHSSAKMVEESLFGVGLGAHDASKCYHSGVSVLSCKIANIILSDIEILMAVLPLAGIAAG